MKTLLQKQKIEALKNKNKQVVSLINEILTEIKNEEVKMKIQDLDEKGIHTVLKRVSKRRVQELDGWKEAGKTRQVDEQVFQGLKEDIKFIENLLPKELSEDELRALVISIKEKFPGDFKLQLDEIKEIPGVNIGLAVKLLKQ